MQPERESPVGKPVSLFVTCMVDMLYPETGWSVVAILEHLGLQIDFPAGQMCCGQPGFNAGHRPEARQVAIQFLKAFQYSQVIVTPSGSCCAMIRHEYPGLFAGDPEWETLAVKLASITWEFTEFLVDGLGKTDLGLSLPGESSIAIHDACHGLRVLGLGEASRSLLRGVGHARLEELPGHDVCCGFGGLFSVKMADVSGAMLAEKTDCINACPAQTIVTGDVSCLTQINGGLSRQRSSKRVRHIADVLAQGLPPSKPLTKAG